MFASFKPSILVGAGNALSALALFVTFLLAGPAALAEFPISKQTPDDRARGRRCSGGSAPVAMAWTAPAVQVLA